MSCHLPRLRRISEACFTPDAPAATAPLVAAALALVTHVGCTELDAASRFPSPDTSRFAVTEVDPPSDATEVPVDQPIDIYFSSFPDPDSATRESFTLTSGGILFTGGFRVDLLERRLRYIPASPLPEHLGMRVRLGTTLRSLDGRPLAEELAWSFSTGRSDGAAPASPPVVIAEDVQPVFTGGCTSCHAAPEARAELDLSSVESAASGLVGRPSVQRPSLARVAAGDHARSYLMRKLLGAPAIVGTRMPPEPSLPLDGKTLRLVANWIDGGARR